MANIGFLEFILFVFFVLVILGVIFIYKRIFGSRDDPDNADIILNGLADYCDGYAWGLLQDMTVGEEMTHIKMIPRDINYLKAKKEKELKIKTQDIFVKNDLLFQFPLSNHRMMWVVLPPRERNLKPTVRNTEFGKLLSNFIELKNAGIETMELKDIREENLKEFVKGHHLGALEIAMGNLKSLKDLNEELAVKLEEKRTKEKDL